MCASKTSTDLQFQEQQALSTNQILTKKNLIDNGYFSETNTETESDASTSGVSVDPFEEIGPDCMHSNFYDLTNPIPYKHSKYNSSRSSKNLKNSATKICKVFKSMVKSKSSASMKAVTLRAENEG